MIESHTAVVERESRFRGEYTTEPYEAAWASDALFFVQCHTEGAPAHHARVQISPDGMRWCDEGTTLEVPSGELTHARVSRFGGWLRLAGDTGGDEVTLTVYLVLEG